MKHSRLFKLLGVLLLSVLVGCSDGIKEVANAKMTTLEKEWANVATSSISASCLGVQMSLNYENVVFQYSGDDTLRFIFGNGKQKTVTVANNEQVYVDPFCAGYYDLHASSDGNVVLYCQIIASVENNIVGYALIRLQYDDHMGEVHGKIIKSVEYPKIGGEFQAVTGEYVQNKINEVKNDKK